MKRRAKRYAGSPFHVVCPFCGVPCTRETPYPWCGGCYVEYYTTRTGSVVFDTGRKTDRFIWAKAFQKAGGLRFGDVGGEKSLPGPE